MSRVFFKQPSNREASDDYDEGGALEESLRQIHARYSLESSSATDADSDGKSSTSSADAEKKK